MNRQQEREISVIFRKIRHYYGGLQQLRRVAKCGYSQLWFKELLDALIISYNEHLFRQLKKLRTAIRQAGLL